MRLEYARRKYTSFDKAGVFGVLAGMKVYSYRRIMVRKPK